MSAPTHHLPDELLHGYATGHANEAQALLVATHLTLCPTCRASVEHFEALGGAILDDPAGAADTKPGALEQLMSRIDTEEPPPPKTPRSNDTLPSGLQWPRPLQAYLSGRRWRKTIAGVDLIELDLHWDHEAVKLVRLPEKFTVPRHTHGGEEYQMVLSGGFVDMGQHFLPGDVAVRNETHVHELRVDPGEACIALNVLNAPLVPKTWIGHLMKRLAGV